GCTWEVVDAGQRAEQRVDVRQSAPRLNVASSAISYLSNLKADTIRPVNAAILYTEAVSYRKLMPTNYGRMQKATEITAMAGEARIGKTLNLRENTRLLSLVLSA